MCLLFAAAVGALFFSAPSPMFGYVAWCDPVVCEDVQWALDQWHRVVASPQGVAPYAVTVRVAALPPKRILGTFEGCDSDRACTVLISPKAVPDLVRATLLHELGHVYGIRQAGARFLFFFLLSLFSSAGSARQLA